MSDDVSIEINNALPVANKSTFTANAQPLVFNIELLEANNRLLTSKAVVSHGNHGLPTAKATKLGIAA